MSSMLHVQRWNAEKATLTVNGTHTFKGASVWFDGTHVRAIAQNGDSLGTLEVVPDEATGHRLVERIGAGEFQFTGVDGSVWLAVAGGSGCGCGG